jgi:hypothetical protein
LFLRSIAVGDFSHLPAAVLSLCETHISGTMNSPIWCTESVCEGFVSTKYCSSCPEMTCQSGFCQAVLSGSEFSVALSMTGKGKVVPVRN